MKNLLLFLVAVLIVSTSSAQWEQTKGPCNGSIRCLAQVGNNIFAGTYDLGMYLSGDNGNSWTPINNGLTNYLVSSIATSGSDVFIGTFGGGIFLSTDNGANWKAVNNGLPSGRVDVLSLTVCEGIIYAGTTGYGIYLSTDNGKSWVSSSKGLVNKVIWSMANDGNRIFAGSEADGPYVSTDKGATWIPINKGLPSWALAVRTFAFKGNDLFIGCGGMYGGGIFRSSDNGESWTALNSGITGGGVFANTLLINNDDIFVGTNDGVYLSKDNGANWTRHVNGFVYPFTIVNALLIKDNNIFAGTESTGMFLSADNGNNWKTVNSGIIGSSISSLLVKDGNIFAGNNSNGVFKSSDKGDSWTAVNNGLWNKDVAALAVVNDHLFAGAGCGGVFLSTDNGDNWKSVNNDLPYLCIYSLVADNDFIYAGTQGGVFYSDNSASNWTSISDGLPVSTYDIKLAISGNNLYAGTANGMYLLNNKGERWSAINAALNKSITAITIIGDYIYAGTQGYGVYTSKNKGGTWAQSNVGLSNFNIRAFCRSGSNIYVATEGGVFLSKDNGLKWVPFNEGWNNKLVKSLVIHSGYLYAATFEGVWKRQLNEAPKIMVSGVVTNSNGEAVEGAILYGLPGNPRTDLNGYFIDSVSAGWSGKITPSLNGYNFAPISRSYLNISVNQENQDFQGDFLSVRSISVSTTSITISQSGISSSNAPSMILVNNGLINSNRSSVGQQASFVEHKMGCLVPDSVVEYWKNHQPAPVSHLKSYSPTIDWSINDSPVKDQGSCGSCWAFATCAYIENISNHADLSEQTLLSCGGSGSCLGGYYDKAMQFVQSDGIPDESCYSYTQESGDCSNMCENPNYKEKIRTVSTELWGVATVDLLKAELQNGPLIVTMQVPFDNAFDKYAGGVYHYAGGVIPPGRGHAVLLVGYDDEQKCFKVKNSWGSAWGEFGYFRISYDDVANEVQFGSYAVKGTGVYTENLSNSSFTISAIGNDDLHIESITTNKPWLTTSVVPGSSFTLASSNSKSITVLVNWGKMGALTETGTISIQSNDPEKPLVTIQVTAIPLCATVINATVTVDGNTTLCTGDYTVLNAGTGDDLIYQWKKNGVVIPDANGSGFIVTSGGAYQVEVTQIGSGCSSESSPIAIVVNQIPPSPSITREGIKLKSNRTSGNQWYDKNGPIAGATNPYFQPQKSGDYYLISTINNCNSLASNTINYIVTDIDLETLNKSFNIYPNPVGNELFIESKGSEGKITFEIVNAIGQVVIKGDFFKTIGVNTSGLPQGAYLIRLTNGDVTAFKKLIRK